MLTIADREEIRRMIVEMGTPLSLGTNDAQAAKVDSSPACPSDSAADSIVDITARAMEVFGTRDKALRWLKSPVPSLGNRTPCSLLSSQEGITQVQDTLGRIEHGVW